MSWLCSDVPQLGVTFLLVVLLVVLAIGAIHLWASNNFYLTRAQTLFICFLSFILAVAAFLVGWFEGAFRFLVFSFQKSLHE